ncbi:major facilitator superfamily domain-containing protein [Sphaerosporella brunnea]|uniref:Major facilitator superfamily domain-containing protein n=1 Tax=Sphaerosporella brunnea TaxID=1250544 RepID=A0A5J5EUY8_9PEZI|nr:major facilitator superfamily domain-containing protein [Sphaerosporella brunnea]
MSSNSTAVESSEVELVHSRHHARTDGEHDGEGNSIEFSLPPVDRGKEAWFFLAGAFMIEALVWGFPFSFGVFQSYYSSHPLFAGNNSIAVIGTTASGIMYLIAPVVFTFLSQFPAQRRKSTVIGLALCVISFIAASFANTVAQLVATQGVMYALGGSLLYAPVIVWLDEWFVQRKGLAYGVMWAGTGTSGLLLPLIINAGLQAYDFRTVHRASAVAMMVLSAPLLYYVQPRLPVPAASTTRSLDYKFLKSTTFWVLQASNIVEGLGFFLPPLYLPSYAVTALRLSPQTSSLLLSLLNAASVPGQIFHGALCDRVHITTVIVVSAVGTALSVFLTWGLGGTLPWLIVFSLLYGFFAGGFTSIYGGMGKEMRRQYPSTEQGLVFGIMAAGRGVGNVVAGPMSEVLLKSWDASGKGAYGSKFGGLVVVTGVTAAVSGAGWIARRL